MQLEEQDNISRKAERLLISNKMVFDFHLRKVTNPRVFILLLHGYAETGKKVFDALLPALPLDAIVLAPNGPFPMPHKTEQGYKVGFSWLFYDPILQEYFIDSEVAVDFLSQGVKNFKFQSLPKIVIGFSQGGFLAPLIACKLENVKQVIGIGCEYTTDGVPPTVPFRIDSIQGDQDAITSLEDAKSSYSLLKQRSDQGEFHLIQGVGHRIDSLVQTKIKEIVSW